VYFGNRSITVHLLRGVLGFASLYAAASCVSTRPWLMVILIPLALFLLKGCPMCWTLGLIETLAMAVHRHTETANSSDEVQCTTSWGATRSVPADEGRRSQPCYGSPNERTSCPLC
jgi:hypothetical protein